VRLMAKHSRDVPGPRITFLDVRASRRRTRRFLATLACPCCAAADTNLGSPPPGGAPPAKRG